MYLEKNCLRCYSVNLELCQAAKFFVTTSLLKITVIDVENYLPSY